MCCSYLEYFESVVDFPVALLCFDFPDKVTDLTLHKGPVVEEAPVNIQGDLWPTPAEIYQRTLNQPLKESGTYAMGFYLFGAEC